MTDRKTDTSACIGPYTSIGDCCQTTLAEVDDTIVIDDAVIDVERKQARSRTRNGAQILKASSLLQEGQGLVVGEKTTTYLWHNELSAELPDAAILHRG